MARNKTLAQLRNGARRRSGLRGDQSLQDSDWTDLVNNAIARIWASLTSDDVGIGHARTTLTATAGVDTVALPADHFSTRGVYRPTSGASGARRPCERRTETWYLERYPEDNGTEVVLPGMYWYRTTNLVLRPIPLVAEQILFTYVVRPTELVADGDTFDVVSDFNEAIEWYAASEAHKDTAQREQAEQRGLAAERRSISRWGARRDSAATPIELYRR